MLLWFEKASRAGRLACRALCDSSLVQEDTQEQHFKKKHSNMCYICFVDCHDEVSAKKHIERNHTLTCDVCNAEEIGEDAMENHILDKHATPENDGYFRCDECNFKSLDKNAMQEVSSETHLTAAASEDD